MGFLDKIKDAAKTAADKAGKIKEEREKAAAIKALKDYGSIEGAGLPEKARFSLDIDNNRIVVREHLTDNYICEYSEDDIQEVKLEKTSELDAESYVSKFAFFNVILNSGEVLKLGHIRRKFQEETEFNKKRENEGNDQAFMIAYHFMLKMKDSNIKEWVNELYEGDDLLPVFGEDGELSVENINNNTANLTARMKG